MAALSEDSGMRRRPIWRRRVELTVFYQGPVLLALGAALLLPAGTSLVEYHGRPPTRELLSYLLPALLALTTGGFLQWRRRPTPRGLLPTEALLVTTASWLLAGMVGALPFIILLDTPVENAVLEAVSGFTTAGTTMLVGLDRLPRSIIVWRMLTQWLGGLGILLLVLIVSRAQGNDAHALLSAEGVKVSSGRLSLNFRRAAYRFIQIYVVLTVGQVIVTTLLGMSLFDAVAHAMTTVSTGGFSPHDESIAFYRNRPDIYPNFVALELVITGFMIAGGINFFVLYRLGRGRLRALWDGLEMRLLWGVLGGATLVTALMAWRAGGGVLVDWLQRSLFEVASLISTTGYEVTATRAFPRLARELFLLLMIVGGCAGSTAGGIKLIRVGLINRFMAHEIRRLRSGPHAVHVPTIDGRPISETAFRQAVFILLLWLFYLVAGGLAITYMAPDYPIADALSTVFTAIGVFGPSFLSVSEVIALPALAKIIFIVGMLAGRLEILPLIVFFNVNAWRK